MPVGNNLYLNPSELDLLLRTADRAALLIPPRLLRRVIKHDCKLTSIGLQVPHHKSYVIDRESLLKLADRDELGLEADRELEPTLLLIARPDPEVLMAQPRNLSLVRYWRILFHASVHRAIRNCGLTEDLVRERIHRIGRAEFDEIRIVLRQEKYLLPPRTDRIAFEEFAALYLELKFFAAPLLPSYFPAIEQFSAIDQVLAKDVAAADLFASSRLEGAPDPVSIAEISPPEPQPEPVPSGWQTGNASEDRNLILRAEQAAVAGNSVLAAILRMRAGLNAPPNLASDAPVSASVELDRLVVRLQAALQLSDAEALAWRQALAVLLPPAARGFWPIEARLLYDLQKICVDYERPGCSVDLIEWAYSGFRQPLVRPLPDRFLVLAAKHLRVAKGRIPSVRVPQNERQAMSALVHGTLHEVESRLRIRFRPMLAEVLGTAGMQPRNFPERMAQEKVIEELLDRISERGFLNLGDVRDVLARNELKLPDLSGAKEWLGGDPLLCANRQLAGRAAGVYHRGEIYLRWMQRGSSLLFGTGPGRWLILFLILPFAGAYASIVFIQEMLHLLRLPHHIEPADLGIAVGGVGLFYLLLLHVPAFRRLLACVLRAVWRAGRAVLIDLPTAILRLPPLRWFTHTRLFLFFVRYVLKPLVPAVVLNMTLRSSGAGASEALAAGAATFLAISLLLNSRLGRDLEEAATDWGVRQWDYFRGLLPGLFHALMDTFKGILEAVDRFLYMVDEWLRFRTGESRLVLAGKIVLGFVWFLLAYLVRLYVNVFIEPTFNPVKHFPAVTVAAKLLVPFWIPLTGILAMPLMFLGAPLAYALAFANVHALAGAAGFLVWELKANWRLYQANRPHTLQPVVFGHHGETMSRLLRPGFHSGTLPKLYAKLRRAERKARRGGSWRSPELLRETLHHIEASVRRLAERELIAFLNETSGWKTGRIHLAAVQAGSNRIRMSLACPALGDLNLELTIEEQSGWLLARVSQAGWLPQLSDEQKPVLATALTGFYKRCGIDLVGEQIESSLARLCPYYDVADEGLVVWPEQNWRSAVTYDLREGPILHPRFEKDPSSPDLPFLNANQLLLGSREVEWQNWVAAWDQIQTGTTRPDPLLPDWRLLCDR